MKDDQKKQLLKKYGRCIRPYESKKQPGIYVSVCPGCRKDISTTDEDLSDVELSVTKRGTATFWHKGCNKNKKIWNSRII